MNKTNTIIGKHWSKITRKSKDRKRWWDSAFILKHINQVVGDEESPEFSQGLIKIIKEKYRKSLPFKKAISVGGGEGTKEMNLIHQGIVDSFDLYELSEKRIAKGKALAQKSGIGHKINFILGDAFELVNIANQYDMVHWNNSLHHMMNVDNAVKWSWHILKPGGVFYMDDFIGSSRFQWPDEQLEVATKVRNVFKNTHFLSHPKYSFLSLPTKAKRPNIKKLIKLDPSEAADSENIVTAIYKYFPDAEIKSTGGVIYHLALNGMLQNFDENEDKITLELLLIIDELCSKLGQTHYGVAWARK